MRSCLNTFQFLSIFLLSDIDPAFSAWFLPKKFFPKVYPSKHLDPCRISHQLIITELVLKNRQSRILWCSFYSYCRAIHIHKHGIRKSSQSSTQRRRGRRYPLSYPHEREHRAPAIPRSTISTTQLQYCCSAREQCRRGQRQHTLPLLRRQWLCWYETRPSR